MEGWTASERGDYTASSTPPKYLCIAQSGRVLHLECRGRRFESSYTDIENMKCINSNDNKTIGAFHVLHNLQDYQQT